MEDNKVKNDLRVAQLNMNRCRAAHDLMTKEISEGLIDVILGQEPNRKIEFKDYCDIDCDSFINLNKKIPVITHVVGKGFVGVELEDFYLISCYFSPNGEIDDFSVLLREMEAIIKKEGKEVIIAGDLNAKNLAIGSDNYNTRGKIFEDWIAQNQMVVLNTGDSPTFVGAAGCSRIDFTIATSRISKRVVKWRVDEETENLSDHRNIRFNIQNVPYGKLTSGSQESGWKIIPEKMKNFTGDIKNKLQGQCYDPEALIEVIISVINKHFRKVNTSIRRRTPVYWWNSEISEKRKE
ncbi:uncharacterized protein LOC130452134, partial [Diorhabda sublineata]|uniref:uncharacterized protein LOC130452134 n=1 Tax=Diorhabda sublineata TaxID=1163346 RepID=UPI0024E17452